MIDVLTQFAYDEPNGVWRAKLQTPNGDSVKIMVVGGADLFDAPSSKAGLMTFVGAVTEYIEKAACVAYESVYREDIDMSGGMDLSSAVITPWDDVRIWFTLRSSQRMLCVKMRSGEPVHVYCDH